MTETFNDNILIDGAQDVDQLRVQGHTTQTQSLQTWENSAETALAQVTGDGRFVVGDDLGGATSESLIEAHRDDSSSAKPKRGFHALGRISNALNEIAQWVVQELEVRGANPLSAQQTALRVRATNMNTGTPDAGAEIRAADIEVSNSEAAGSAPLPKATGLRIGVTNAEGRTIDKAIGLQIQMNNEGSITAPYAIYTEGVGAVHLDDYLELKRPAVVPGIPAMDTVRLYPKDDGKLYAKDWNGQEHDLAASGGGVVDVETHYFDVDLPPASGQGTRYEFNDAALPSGISVFDHGSYNIAPVSSFSEDGTGRVLWHTMGTLERDKWVGYYVDLSVGSGVLIEGKVYSQRAENAHLRTGIAVFEDADDPNGHFVTVFDEENFTEVKLEEWASWQEWGFFSASELGFTFQPYLRILVTPSGSDYVIEGASSPDGKTWRAMGDSRTVSWLPQHAGVVSSFSVGADSNNAESRFEWLRVKPSNEPIWKGFAQGNNLKLPK